MVYNCLFSASVVVECKQISQLSLSGTVCFIRYAVYWDVMKAIRKRICLFSVNFNRFRVQLHNTETVKWEIDPKNTRSMSRKKKD